jgi:hypothetical protein
MRCGFFNELAHLYAAVDPEYSTVQPWLGYTYSLKWDGNGTSRMR